MVGDKLVGLLITGMTVFVLLVLTVCPGTLQAASLSRPSEDGKSITSSSPSPISFV